MSLELAILAQGHPGAPQVCLSRTADSGILAAAIRCCIEQTETAEREATDALTRWACRDKSAVLRGILARLEPEPVGAVM